MANRESPAHTYDRFMMRTSYAMFLLAFVVGLDAAVMLIEGGLTGWMETALDIVQTGSAILIVVMLLPLTLRVARLRSKARAACYEPESFMRDAYMKAATRAFTFVFVTLVVSMGVFDRIEFDVPVLFYLRALMSSAVLVFGISFIVQTRDTDGEDDDFANDDFEGSGE